MGYGTYFDDHGYPSDASEVVSIYSSLHPQIPSTSLDLSRTEQTRPSLPSLSNTTPYPFPLLSSTTTTKLVPTSPPTSLPVIPASASILSSVLPQASSIISPNPDPLTIISTTQSTPSLLPTSESLASTSAADNVTPTFTSGATRTPAPLYTLSRHSLPTSTIAAAVIIPLAAIALIGAAVFVFLQKRRQKGYSRPGSGSQSVGVAETAIAKKDSEKLLRSESHDTTSTIAPSPAYVIPTQHVRATSESVQPMLSAPQQNFGSGVVDRAYYTGIDTASEASIHDGLSAYRNSAEGSFMGEAPPPYVRSMGSGRSARSGSTGASTLRVPTSAGIAANRRSIAGQSVAEDPEIPQADVESPFADPTGVAHGHPEQSPFDDAHAAKDDDAVSDISESEVRERDRVSMVSDFSYQSSLRGLPNMNDVRSRR
ncbi:hypothetical protein EV356DRAFT_342293 [Viridothelium virens]|uniref:Uncharacterized protein n=1 Tax=Viridothelium virens TaxID=1048519 RepID=A0A6A6GXB9_VIRVR|nr:hypothetical protein EV356DRAFT_342293 [Viridothelium virens]